MSEQLTLGVIGHVDHGKTALVRALTGVETDRLREEKERGLSIVLGFSYLETPAGSVDLIDVPGHEDFVRMMISGATGIDGALLIVAANEGIMPQSREHLAIAELLGVDRGLIVVTKTDLVDDEELELAIDDIRDYTESTFLRDAPLVLTSAETGEGLDELRAAIGRLEPVSDRATVKGHAFLPADRVFVMRGFGVVVTGTLRGGPLAVNDDVDVLPSGLSAGIRGLQVHGESVEVAHPGQRVAVNLRNVKREELNRGDSLASPGYLRATPRLDVELELLPNESLKNGQMVRLLIGTTEIMAKLRLLDAAKLEPGARGLVQLRCQRKVATPVGERFIVRRVSPIETIGGGRVLDVNPERHRRFDAAITRKLEAAAVGDVGALVAASIAEAGLHGIGRRMLCERAGIDDATLVDLLGGIETVAVGPDKLVDAQNYDELEAAIVGVLDAFHQAHSHQRGVDVGTLRAELEQDVNDDVYQHAINALVASDQIENLEGSLCAKGFDPLGGLSERERKIAGDIEQAFLRAGLESPDVTQIARGDSTRRELIRLLQDTGRLVRLKTPDRKLMMLLHTDTLDGIVAQLREQYAGGAKFTLSEVRELLGSTRKYVVPLMEHLDATGVTLRMGNDRRIQHRR